ncbi:LON peptidase substrate-binding domain-containing protein [Pilimelia columellifera]|uniref:LON peptidase substrate-binding domain-containing protein n=1 Tax=Pilimelia columellifera subsp. columellifera TaxID=706583 RepID=A0ABP6AJM7_9ACTN
MSVALPLFPLNTVLFPGLVLPLNVFEDRYRALVRHLMDLPDGTPREFGVIAIHRGEEVAPAAGTRAGAAVTLHSVGCVASLRQVTEREDGRLDIVAVGGRRFQITGLEITDKPYLVADAEALADEAGDGADELAPRVLAALRGYLATLRPEAELAEQLPDDARLLSYLVAATAELTVADRQRLLAAPDAATRLRMELGLLRRETQLLARVRAVPRPLSHWAVSPLN